MKELMDMDKKVVSIRGTWIVGTAALTKAQNLEINMFITCSSPPSRRNDTPGMHDALKVVWQWANFDTVVRQESMKNKGRMIVTRM